MEKYIVLKVGKKFIVADSYNEEQAVGCTFTVESGADTVAEAMNEAFQAGYNQRIKEQS